MRNGTICLDTNAAIAVVESDVKAIAVIKSAQQLFLPVAVVGELVYGAYRSARRESNLQRVMQLVRTSTVLPIDFETGFEFGRLRFEREIAGKPVPMNDYWIAASCLRHDHRLMTRDHHFRDIPGLTLVDW